MLRLGVLLAAGLISGAAVGQDVSVAHGEHISIIGGYDCHSAGFAEAEGKIDPATALTGNPVGYSGPWGTTYAANLRIAAAKMTEDEWVTYLKTFKTGPPMPWFNVHRLTETDTRSLYQYIKSLGEVGEPEPENLAPGVTPKTPYVVFAPPIMPAN